MQLIVLNVFKSCLLRVASRTPAAALHDLSGCGISEALRSGAGADDSDTMITWHLGRWSLRIQMNLCWWRPPTAKGRLQGRLRSCRFHLTALISHRRTQSQRFKKDLTDWKSREPQLAQQVADIARPLTFSHMTCKTVSRLLCRSITRDANVDAGGFLLRLFQTMVLWRAVVKRVWYELFRVPEHGNNSFFRVLCDIFYVFVLSCS